MRAYLKYLWLVVAFLGAAGCTKTDPAEPNGKACESDNDCSGERSACDINGGGTCVVCIPGGKTDACTGATPVCGEDKACHGCVVHSDCIASDACLPDGTCATEDQIVYLKAGGLGTSCSKGQACGNLFLALAQVTSTRQYIRVTGTIENTNYDINNKVITFLGSTDAVLRGAQQGAFADNPIIDLRNAAAKLAIYDVTFRDGNRAGIRVNDGASLLLQRSKVINNAEEGVLIVNGSAKIEQSEIFSNGGGSSVRRGVTLTIGELTVSRSRIAENSGGGILIADMQKLIISNTFVVGNRGSGGIQVPKPALGSKFEFVTVADNRDESGTGVSDVGGVYCDDDAFTFSNSIIFRNSGGSGGFQQTVGTCKFDGTFQSPEGAADTSSLGFVKDTVPRDYHLTAGSPASVRDVSGAVCTGLLDYDGESRPQGSACDLGADELKQ